LPQPTVQMTFEEAVPVEVVPEIDDTPVDDVEPEVVDVEPKVVEVESRPLVPITLAKIGDNKVNSVSARDLYLDLGMDGSNWAKWSRINIAENIFFSLGVDFIELVPSTSSPNPAKEYAVSIEMAKHLAMMAKTQRAHDYRNYFIECEKIAKGEASKIEPKPESSLIENMKAASAVIDVTMTMLNRLGIEGNQATLGANKVQVINFRTSTVKNSVLIVVSREIYHKLPQ
jgi:phage anti-repressor protein